MLFTRNQISNLITIAALLSLLCLTAINANAQTADLSGNVKDVNGASIPNARIALKNEAINTVRETTANSGGFFALTQIPSGNYTLEVNSQGFAARLSDVVLNVGDRRSLRA